MLYGIALLSQLALSHSFLLLISYSLSLVLAFISMFVSVCLFFLWEIGRRSSHFGRSDRNVPFHLTKLFSPPPLFCVLLTSIITKSAVAWVGSVQPEYTVPLGAWNVRNFKPEFLLNGKSPGCHSDFPFNGAKNHWTLLLSNVCYLVFLHKNILILVLSMSCTDTFENPSFCPSTLKRWISVWFEIEITTISIWRNGVLWYAYGVMAYCDVLYIRHYFQRTSC